MTVIILAYLGGVLLVGLVGGAGVYHALKFGYPGDKTRLAVVLYLTVAAVVVIASLIALGSTDLQEVA